MYTHCKLHMIDEFSLSDAVGVEYLVSRILIV
jgi:hypothetical protein